MWPAGLVRVIQCAVRRTTSGPIFTKQKSKTYNFAFNNNFISKQTYMHRNLILYIYIYIMCVCVLKFTILLKCHIFFDMDHYHFILVCYLVTLHFLTSFLTDPNSLHSAVDYRIHKHPPFSILDQINPVHDSHPTSSNSHLILSYHLHLRLPSGIVPSGLPIKTLYAPILSHIHAT